MSNELDIKKIEYGIYSHIMQDFAEYFNNRMNVYSGVTAYLSSITKQHFNDITTDEVYKEYKQYCENNNLVCLKPKSFGRVMNGMCGFETTRKKVKGVYYYYYQEVVA